jgi:hypothetical protein
VRDLYHTLLDYDLVLLRAIAEQWGITLVARQPREMAAELAEQIARPERLKQAWHDDVCRPALAALAAAGGRMAAPQFDRRFGEVRRFGPGRLERERPWAAPANPAEALWYRGLIGRAFESGPAGPQAFVYIPPDVLEMTDSASQRSTIISGVAAAEPEQFTPAPTTLVDDLCTLLARLQVSRTTADRQGRSALRRRQALARHLLDATGVEDDTARFAFLWGVGLAAGLIAAGRYLKPAPEQARAWLSTGREAQLAALAAAWRDDPNWNDLWRVPSLRPEDTGWRNDPLLARRAILRMLAALNQENAWWDLPAFIAAVKAHEPDFQRPTGDYASWYIRDAASGEYVTGFESWDAVEGALIRYLISGPLHWLGQADIAAGAFRLTPRGVRFLAGQPPAPDAEDAARLSIQPDGSMHAPRTANRYDRFQIARVTTWVAAGETYEYRFTPGSLARAQEQGIHVQQVLNFLGRASGGDVPDALTRALRRWEQAGTQVRLRDLIVLQAASAEVLGALRAAPATRTYLGEALGPLTVAVRRADWPRLEQALRELGYLPEVEELGD